MIVHEVIADLHGDLAALGASTARSLELLHQSARIVLEEVPRLTRDLHEAARRWEEQNLLDPDAAAETLRTIEAGLVELEPQLEALHIRQEQVASEIRSLVEPD